jgi:hypothetical protein
MIKPIVIEMRLSSLTKAMNIGKKNKQPPVLNFLDRQSPPPYSPIEVLIISSDAGSLKLALRPEHDPAARAAFSISILSHDSRIVLQE